MQKAKQIFKNLSFVCTYLLVQHFPVRAQERKWEDIDKTGYYKEVTLKRGEYSLKFINKDANFNSEVQKRLIELYFNVYPKEVERFNSRASRNVTFVIGDYKGVAATVNDIVKFDPAWFAKYPEDIDCATHELMHVVQAYHFGVDCPGWLTEGIADYGRFLFGINNNNANWKLEYHPGQKYTYAYRTTARFLVWVEKHNKNFVAKLNNTITAGKYSEKTWTEFTGKSVDELWSLYENDPDIS